MARHHSKRGPRKNTGFSWGRFPLNGCTDYRLFRRDHTGALHMERIAFHHTTTRQQIAADVRAARNELRDRVDAICLAAWGVAA